MVLSYNLWHYTPDKIQASEEERRGGTERELGFTKESFISMHATNCSFGGWVGVVFSSSHYLNIHWLYDGKESQYTSDLE